jgi:hypothetical protein
MDIVKRTAGNKNRNWMVIMSQNAIFRKVKYSLDVSLTINSGVSKHMNMYLVQYIESICFDTRPSVYSNNEREKL